MILIKIKFRSVEVVSNSAITMADESAKTNTGPFKRLKLLVFGGTGVTGKEVVKQALHLGHDVTVIARNPEKLQGIE